MNTRGMILNIMCRTLFLVYFTTYDGNYITSCISSFFPGHDDSIETECQMLYVSILHVCKKVINFSTDL